MLFICIQRNLFIGEEHKMVNKNFSGFLQSILRVNRTVGLDFDNQLVVVSSLLNTHVLNIILNVNNRCENRADWNNADSIVECSVFIRLNITSALYYRQVHLKGYRRLHPANQQVWIQNLETRKELSYITSPKFFLSGYYNRYIFVINILDLLFETNLLKLKNYLSDIFHNSGYCGKFVIHTLYLHG